MASAACADLPRRRECPFPRNAESSGLVCSFAIPSSRCKEVPFPPAAVLWIEGCRTSFVSKVAAIRLFAQPFGVVRPVWFPLTEET
jgi:hypothetical protein